MACLRDSFQDGVVLDGRFKTVSPLNHGSFGMVFMAEDLETNELVAIKCLTKKSAAAALQMDINFAIDEKSEELDCHALLGSHPNIVNLIHSFETEAHVYLVLEFCSRGDLYEAIRTGCGPLNTEHVREFMLQLVDAVEYIHSKGLYHRDIKPENIFLLQDGTMKLGDFGLATTDKWTYETNVGSDRYMSPEQYDSDGAGYSPAMADVWAVGICLLNVLFSRNPFTTPTESDPLFYDFSRDKQSLFDVFPTMSQDTYEVVAAAMSLDPNKRSLAGVRDALERVVSFTTDEESLDEFCAAKPQGIASANREPLRTPSIQSPTLAQDAFPWAKALRASPLQQVRQLSVIHDDENYDEDLFPHSEDSRKDWFSIAPETPSMASMLDSSLGASFRSMAIRRPMKTANPPRADLTPISGSLPTAAISKPQAIPSVASVFGRKQEPISKSWSDLWDEDFEEEEEAHDKALKERQSQNARTWSQDSKSNENDFVKGGLSEPKTSSFVNIKSVDIAADRAESNDVDGDLDDGFFFQGTSLKSRHESPPRYSPPSKRTNLDKWAALGDRRRAHGGSFEKSQENVKETRNVGLGFAGFGTGFWDSKMSNKGKGCPWTKARDIQPPRQHQYDAGAGGDLGDLEWVGGWPHGGAA